MQLIAQSDESPYCDHACGTRAEIRLRHVGLCWDCAGRALGDALEEILGEKVCGQILHVGRLHALCLHLFGLEHDHCGLMAEEDGASEEVGADGNCRVCGGGPVSGQMCECERDHNAA